MNREKITLKNVRVHNLKGVDLTLEPNQFIVFTGVSGSGKSSLAFDTIYTEGQRRYVESLSSYAKRYLGDFPKPEADSIEGISPTIAIEQKGVGKNPRSTVGTMTGIYDFLRVLFARIAIPHCPISLEPLSPQSIHQILGTLLSKEQERKIILLSPYATGKKGDFKEDFEELLKKGFTRIRLDGAITNLEEAPSLDSLVSHDIDIVIDRITVSEENKSRLTESLQTALNVGHGIAKVLDIESHEETLFSQHAFSEKSGLSYPPLEPQDFSFNHPSGMCPECQGLGTSQEFDLTKIIDEDKSISEDCCKVASSFQTIRYGNIYKNLAKLYNFSVETPWKDLPIKGKNAFLFGTKTKWTKMTFVHPEKKTSSIEYVQWKGVLFEAKERYSAAQSELYRKKMEQYLHETCCRACSGSKIKPYPSAAKLGNLTIQELTSLSLKELIGFFSTLCLSPVQKQIGEEMVKEIVERLSFLEKVGLQYLSLNRTAPTLSGGEGQRVRLASQIGSGLVGSTYILDEPSIGLHPQDNHKLLQSLIRLKDQGNTVIVVEHDEETILAADYIVDFGPLAGKNGGQIVAKGSFEDILNAKNSLTGAYLSGKAKIVASKKRKPVKDKEIRLYGASHHNLKDVNLKIPLGLFLSITGVSGSGKSSLILDTLYPALANLLQNAALAVGNYKKIEGHELIDKVIAIDQSPIGRTPRSNPSTYIKLFDEIRDLFAKLPESRAQGFESGRFSFNVSEGSCSLCQGMGMTKVDMDFLEDEWSPCSSCNGKRFDDITLSVHFKGKSIYDVLEMSVQEAFEFFKDQPKIKSKLDLLMQVGLDYIKLGQPSPTLSGGESQRIKLAKELSRPSTGKTLYILDEPTTGLHFHDIQNLAKVLHSLVDKGNTVLLIEHNIDLIKSSDWIIDLGPEAGLDGGKIIGEGSLDKIKKLDTPTGRALRQNLGAEKRVLVATPPLKELKIRGACQNNLKSIDVDIPLGAITVCTGPSGSGKSSLAFETIYAEGQRRYTDSMSNYARQFIKQMSKPKVDQIEGLSASIAIEQKNHAGNPRSTIGTMTEIHDYLRILYSTVGTPFCPETGEEIKQVSIEYVTKKALSLPLGSKLLILSPLSLVKQESFKDLQEKLLKQGFQRIRLNGEILHLEEEIAFDPKKKNELFLVIDRLILGADSYKRLFQGIEQATSLSKNQVVLMTPKEDMAFNLAFTVESTGKSYTPITPHTFSFNTDHGMCLECQGLGFQYGISESLLNDLVLLSPLDLLLLLTKENTNSFSLKMITKVLKDLGIDPNFPITDLPPEKQELFLQGSPSSKEKHPLFSWRGLIPLLINYSKSSSGNIRQILSSLLLEQTCPACEGTRLSPLARNVKIASVSIATLSKKTIDDSLLFISSLEIPETKKDLLEETLTQITKRLTLLIDIGLGYLSLDRSAPTLSGGETQRIRLSRQLGSGLSGCLYILDEPTIGLHPFDNHLLNKALRKLQALGNTLILVEHDPMTLEIADYILDFGPGAGIHGGQIMAKGTPQEILQNENSLTGAYLSGRKKILLPKKRRSFEKVIEIENVSLHNIKNLSLSIPIGTLTSFTGVSGSGKSTLLMGILRPAVEKLVAAKKRRNAFIEENLQIQGIDHFDKLIVLEQNPIGTTSRADISTYTELLTPIRHLYASLPEAKMRGLEPKHFSYNHPKGMCRTCWGHGTQTVSLQFLPSVKVPCEDCQGLKLAPLSLNVYFKGKNLGQLLSLSVLEARDFFSAIPKITKILDTLISVGLGYLTLGQEVASLSGGESQRLRLSCELAKRSTGKTLYLLDEPSIGLHSQDIEKLVSIFQALVNKGNTVILIEHNLDLIAQCDYLLDMGPGPGAKGGTLVASGTPEEVARSKSKTAPFLKTHLENLKSLIHKT